MLSIIIIVLLLLCCCLLFVAWQQQQRERFFTMPMPPRFVLVFDGSRPCPGCERTQQLLNELRVHYEMYDVDQRDEDAGIDNHNKFKGVSTFPTLAAMVGGDMVDALPGGAYTADELDAFVSKVAMARIGITPRP